MMALIAARHHADTVNIYILTSCIDIMHYILTLNIDDARFKVCSTPGKDLSDEVHTHHLDLSERSCHTTAIWLIEKVAYRTKYRYHAMQGHEGRVPVPQEPGSLLRMQGAHIPATARGSFATSGLVRPSSRSLVLVSIQRFCVAALTCCNSPPLTRSG